MSVLLIGEDYSSLLPPTSVAVVLLIGATISSALSESFPD